MINSLTWLFIHICEFITVIKFAIRICCIQKLLKDKEVSLNKYQIFSSLIVHGYLKIYNWTERDEKRVTAIISKLVVMCAWERETWMYT